MKYKNSRDVAWEMLKNHNIKVLLVRVQKICKRECVKFLACKERKVMKEFDLLSSFSNDFSVSMHHIELYLSSSFMTSLLFSFSCF